MLQTAEKAGTTENPTKYETDPGCLPAWEVDDMPAPVEESGIKKLLRAIGPGLVMIGGTIGTGELIIGSSAAWKYQGAMLWVAPLAIIAQVILNTEVMRYTLVTGEPIFTGFMRTRPGPKFWLLGYFFLDILGWLPALAGLAAQVLVFTVMGRDPMQEEVRWVSCAILLLCGLLLCFGGKIYNTLEVVLGGKVLFVLAFMITSTVFFVPWDTWVMVLHGMVNPTYLPPGEGKINWNVVGAVAGLAGIGGLGNLLASNYVREKGWGMGSKVGAIGSAFGGHEISLSHLGTIARPTAEGVTRFRLWWGRVQRDQFGLWAIGSVIGMALPCILGAHYISRDYLGEGGNYTAAVGLARDFGNARGPIFLVLTLLCAFVILFPGQFSSMDGIARRWCDAFWSGSKRARCARPDKVRYLYYSFVGLYVTIGIIVNGFGISAKNMMVFNANLANFSITACILHTLYVNTHVIPKEFRPTRLKQSLLAAAALFYGSMFALSANQTLQKLMQGTLFS